MAARLNVFGSQFTAMHEFIAYSSDAAAKSDLDKHIVDLVKIRASQLNRCANCLNMHTLEAHKAGETDQRLHLIAAWQEAPVFSDRERAALAWTDHLTLIADQGVPESVYQALSAHFSETEQVELTLIICQVNSYNRLAVGFGFFVKNLGW